MHRRSGLEGRALRGRRGARGKPRAVNARGQAGLRAQAGAAFWAKSSGCAGPWSEQLPKGPTGVPNTWKQKGGHPYLYQGLFLPGRARAAHRAEGEAQGPGRGRISHMGAHTGMHAHSYTHSHTLSSSSPLSLCGPGRPPTLLIASDPPFTPPHLLQLALILSFLLLRVRAEACSSLLLPPPNSSPGSAGFSLAYCSNPGPSSGAAGC